MSEHLNWVLSTGFVILIALVGLIYRNIVSRVDEVKASLKEGLSAKVDGIEYMVKTKWQEAEYGDLKLTIKELRASNDDSHAAIMIELRKTNDILKKK